MTGQLYKNPVARMVNGETVVVLGWGRAILYQLAHPLVAAGVGEHSDFKAGSLEYARRSYRTISAMLGLTFGSDDEVRGKAEGINRVHRRVHGRLREPMGRFPAKTPYSATSPELLKWVHATLVESQLITYELFVGPLSGPQKSRYCAEAAALAPLLGIPLGLLPQTTGDLDTYLTEMMASDTIEVTDTARELAHALLFPSGALVRLWFGIPRLLTIGLLSPDLREAYGFPWSRRQDRWFRRLARTLRFSSRVLPPALRLWPQARIGATGR